MTYVVHPVNEAQEKAIKAIFEALQVPYDEEPQIDETEHLLSTEANTKRLMQAEESFKQGDGTVITMEELNALWR